MMIVKLSFLVAASFAAFAVSQIKTNSTKSQDFDVMESEKVEEKMLQEEKKNRVIRSSKMLSNVREKEILLNEIEQRKVNLQGKLLELYGLKEEKRLSAELRASLEEKAEEIGTLEATLASLQADKESLKEEIKDGALAARKLEAAKKMVAEMERKFCTDARRIKGRVSMIEERVCGFQGDQNSPRNALIEQKLKAVENFEFEVGKKKRINKELELEKRELTVKLLAAQERIASLSNITEDKVIGTIEDEISTLRHSNEELSTQIETLHKERIQNLEQLVYQRWLNICLRFEAQNKDNLNTKNTQDKAKSQTFSCPSFSSFSFSSSESDQVETSSSSKDSNSSQNSSRKSSGFITRRIACWGSGSKDDSGFTSSAEKTRNSAAKARPVRRFSTSMIKNKGPGQSAVKLTEKPARVRRVSFSDHLVYKVDDIDVPNAALDRQKGDEKSTVLEGEEKPEIVSFESIDRARLENFQKETKENRVEEDQMVQSLSFAVLGFLLLMFIAYYFLYTTRRFLKT